MKAALASAAIHQIRPDLFWDVHEFFFKSQKEITTNNIDEKFESFLASKDVSIDDYKKRATSPEVKKAVEADMQEAGTLGFNSVPTFFVNGRRIGGNLPVSEFKKAFDEAFAESGGFKQ